MVLGGLSNSSEIRQKGGILILSDLPIIKRLFLNSVTNKQRVHNVFLVTPTILIEKEYAP